MGDNGGMDVTDPQIWVLIGTFSAVLVGVLTLTVGLTLRTVRAEIGQVRHELRGEIKVLSADIARVEGVMNARFETVERRLDGLDRDVTALTKRVMGDGA